MSSVKEIEPVQLSELLSEKQPLQLVDVREPHEREICSIGGNLLPLADLPQSLAQLDPALKTIVYCRSGTRSRSACDTLAQAGFDDVNNLAGGILAWIDTIDSSMTRY